jgi:hypothetical protein
VAIHFYLLARSIICGDLPPHLPVPSPGILGTFCSKHSSSIVIITSFIIQEIFCTVSSPASDSKFCVFSLPVVCIQGNNHLTNDETAISYHVTMTCKTCSDSQNSYCP